MSYQHTGPLNVDEARRHIGERVAYSGPAGPVGEQWWGECCAE